MAWYIDNSSETKDVGTKNPNQLGLYDCSGNVYEWCYDTNGGVEKGKNYRYVYNSSNEYHIIRGGSYNCRDYEVVISDIKRNGDITWKNWDWGFRIVRTV